MKKILIMGGTGAMGQYLVPMLAADSNYQVFVTSRSAKRSGKHNITYLKGNAKDHSWIEVILHSFEFDFVFDFMKYGLDEFKDRIDLLLRNSGHYFYLSTYRVLGEAPILTENSPVKCAENTSHPEYAIDRYGWNKALSEKALRKCGRNNYTIIRPSMTFSNDRFQFFSGDNFDVMRASKGVPTLLPESALNLTANLTYGRNVAMMLKELMSKADISGQTFHVVTRSVTWSEITQAFQNVFGMECHIVPDAKYLELVDVHDGRILDRFRSRNISNEKVLSTTGIDEKDFGTLEDNLAEAWDQSNKEAYRASMASIGAMARFDYATNSQVSLGLFSPKAKSLYFQQKKAIEDRIWVSDFWVRPNSTYWDIRRSHDVGGAVAVKRNHTFVTSHAWLNFRNFSFLRGFQIDRTYSLKIIIHTDMLFKIRPFLHLFGKEIMRLPTKTVKPGDNIINIDFQPRLALYSDLAITGTEVGPATAFIVQDIDISPKIGY